MLTWTLIPCTCALDNVTGLRELSCRESQLQSFSNLPTAFPTFA